jgi:methyltransferase (TIGR00027 family)
MEAGRASRTAGYMAFYRALETARGRRRRISDPLAAHFLDRALGRAVRLSRLPLFGPLVRSYADWRAPGARTSGIARTWLIDEWLCAALADDIGQVVILGSGFDCRAYRLPCLRSTTILEVDHPATLALKRERLSAILPKIPDNVQLIGIDFARDDLRFVLAGARLDEREPTVFVWEGVTNYLNAAAIDSVLAVVAGNAVRTRLIFTYVHRGAIDGSVMFDGAARLRRNVERLGEPWTFGLVPEELPTFLRARGLRLERDLGARAYRRECFGEEGERMRGYDFYHVADAVVPAVNRADA